MSIPRTALHSDFRSTFVRVWFAVMIHSPTLARILDRLGTRPGKTRGRIWGRVVRERGEKTRRGKERERVWAAKRELPRGAKRAPKMERRGESRHERRSCLARFRCRRDDDSLRRPILNSSRSPRSRYQHPPAPESFPFRRSNPSLSRPLCQLDVAALRQLR